MHEFGVTDNIIKGLLHQLDAEKVTQVISVRFQRSSAFSEEVLMQTFGMLSAGTCLDGATLIVDVQVLNVTCACGQASVVTSDDLMGHAFVCPNCGAVREIEEAHDLELLEVIAETEAHEGSPDGLRA